MTQPETRPEPTKPHAAPHARADAPRRPQRRFGATPVLACAGVVAALAFAAVLGSEGPLGPALTLLGQRNGGEGLARDQDAALYLVRSSLMALDDANRTGNYSVLRDLASPSFQSANSAARLAEIFASQRAGNLDLSVAALDQPVWSIAPTVGGDGLLRLAGHYARTLDRLEFALAFEPAGGAWRLYEIHVRPLPREPRRLAADAH